MDTSLNRESFDALVEKIEVAKKSGTVDLSTDEDLSIAVMNLVSLEEHLFFTYGKTGTPSYLDMLNELRSIRKSVMARLVSAHEGETWCITKHLLATTRRLIEVGTKLYADGDTVRARETFDYAYKIYAMFWGIKLKAIDIAGMKKAAGEERLASGKKPWTLTDIVDKLVDCCDE
jgi:hypothetical protein